MADPANSSTESQLIRLPAELRLHIYDHVFAVPDSASITSSVINAPIRCTCRILRHETIEHYRVFLRQTIEVLKAKIERYTQFLDNGVAWLLAARGYRAGLERAMREEDWHLSKREGCQSLVRRSEKMLKGIQEM